MADYHLAPLSIETVTGTTLIRELDGGLVTVKKRGSPLDTDALARQLRGTGQRSLVVVLSHMPTGPIAVICSADRADMVT